MEHNTQTANTLFPVHMPLGHPELKGGGIWRGNRVFTVATMNITKYGVVTEYWLFDTIYTHPSSNIHLATRPTRIYANYSAHKW
jgi:hypothetical protein